MTIRRKATSGHYNNFRTTPVVGSTSNKLFKNPRVDLENANAIAIGGVPVRIRPPILENQMPIVKKGVFINETINNILNADTNIIFVNTLDGDDNFEGTFIEPLKSLGAAYDIAEAGAVIVIMDYTTIVGNFIFNKENITIVGDHTTITSAGNTITIENSTTIRFHKIITTGDLTDAVAINCVDKIVNISADSIITNTGFGMRTIGDGTVVNVDVKEVILNGANSSAIGSNNAITTLAKIRGSIVSIIANGLNCFGALCLSGNTSNLILSISNFEQKTGNFFSCVRLNGDITGNFNCGSVVSNNNAFDSIGGAKLYAHASSISATNSTVCDNISTVYVVCAGAVIGSSAKLGNQRIITPQDTIAGYFVNNSEELMEALDNHYYPRIILKEGVVFEITRDLWIEPGTELIAERYGAPGYSPTILIDNSGDNYGEIRLHFGCSFKGIIIKINYDSATPAINAIRGSNATWEGEGDPSFILFEDCVISFDNAEYSDEDATSNITFMRSNNSVQFNRCSFILNSNKTTAPIVDLTPKNNRIINMFGGYLKIDDVTIVPNGVDSYTYERLFNLNDDSTIIMNNVSCIENGSGVISTAAGANIELKTTYNNLVSEHILNQVYGMSVNSTANLKISNFFTAVCETTMPAGTEPTGWSAFISCSGNHLSIENAFIGNYVKFTGNDSITFNNVYIGQAEDYYGMPYNHEIIVDDINGYALFISNPLCKVHINSVKISGSTLVPPYLVWQQENGVYISSFYVNLNMVYVSHFAIISATKIIFEGTNTIVGSEIINFLGEIPTSLYVSGQPWNKKACFFLEGDPGIVSCNSHGLLDGTRVMFSVEDTTNFPPDLDIFATYIVINATDHTFNVYAAVDPTMTPIQFLSPASTGCTFTAIPNNLVNSVAHGLLDDTPIVFFANFPDVLPSGISEGVTYYVKNTDPVDPDTFQLTTTPGGATLDIVDDGVGASLAYATNQAGMYFTQLINKNSSFVTLDLTVVEGAVIVCDSDNFAINGLKTLNASLGIIASSSGSIDNSKIVADGAALITLFSDVRDPFYLVIDVSLGAVSSCCGIEICNFKNFILDGVVGDGVHLEGKMCNICNSKFSGVDLLTAGIYEIEMSDFSSIIGSFLNILGNAAATATLPALGKTIITGCQYANGGVLVAELVDNNLEL